MEGLINPEASWEGTAPDALVVPALDMLVEAGASQRKITRREFLKLAGATATAALLASCFPECPVEPSAITTEAPIVSPPVGSTEIPTTITPKWEEPTVEVTRAPTPEPGSAYPIEEGASLEVGGALLNPQEFPANYLADLIVKVDSNLQVVARGDTGKVVCYSGLYEREDGVQEWVVALGQGPRNARWAQARGQVWEVVPEGQSLAFWQRNTQTESLHVVVPDVSLPGAFNEEKGYAAPALVPESALLVKDIRTGDYRVVVVYDEKTLQEAERLGMKTGIQEVTDKDGVRKGIFIGESKSVTLEPGQTITRGEEGLLQTRNAFGRVVSEMKTRWEHIRSKEEEGEMMSWIAPTYYCRGGIQIPSYDDDGSFRGNFGNQRIEGITVVDERIFGLGQRIKIEYRYETKDGKKGTERAWLKSSDFDSSGNFLREGEEPPVQPTKEATEEPKPTKETEPTKEPEPTKETGEPTEEPGEATKEPTKEPEPTAEPAGNPIRPEEIAHHPADVRISVWESKWWPAEIKEGERAVVLYLPVNQLQPDNNLIICDIEVGTGETDKAISVSPNTPVYIGPNYRGTAKDMWSAVQVDDRIILLTDEGFRPEGITFEDLKTIELHVRAIDLAPPE